MSEQQPTPVDEDPRATAAELQQRAATDLANAQLTQQRQAREDRATQQRSQP